MTDHIGKSKSEQLREAHEWSSQRDKEASLSGEPRWPDGVHGKDSSKSRFKNFPCVEEDDTSVVDRTVYDKYDI